MVKQPVKGPPALYFQGLANIPIENGNFEPLIVSHTRKSALALDFHVATDFGRKVDVGRMRVSGEPFSPFLFPDLPQPLPPFRKRGGQQDQAGPIGTLPCTDRHPFKKIFIPIIRIFSDKMILASYNFEGSTKSSLNDPIWI